MEKESNEARTGDAAIVRLRPLRVLVVSGDRRFRAVTTMLLTRRGVAALSCSSVSQAAMLLDVGLLDVLVVDRVALLNELANAVADAPAHVAPVGVVAALAGDETAPSELVTVAKWAPFECVYAAIERADRRRQARRRATPGASGLSLVVAQT